MGVKVSIHTPETPPPLNPTGRPHSMPQVCSMAQEWGLVGQRLVALDCRLAPFQHRRLSLPPLSVGRQMKRVA